MCLEPTYEWKVEELFQWLVLRAHNDTDKECDSECAKRLVTFEAMKKKFLAETLDNAENKNAANITSQTPTTTTAMTATVGSVRNTVKTTQVDQSQAGKASMGVDVRVRIAGGPHHGLECDLKVTRHGTSLVGRSRQKKVKANGVSLFKDNEVSTIHGQFLLDSTGRLCFEDLDSTNGSCIHGEQIAKHNPVALKNGEEILLGQSLMVVTYNG